MEIINGIKLSVEKTEKDLLKKACKISGLNANKIKHFKILKKSLDARDKNNLLFVYSVEISEQSKTQEKIVYNKINKSVSVLVVGAGPSGLFSALDLCRMGFNVTLIERGDSVENRQTAVDGFIKTKVLNEDSNIQFGEGGAGAFSDGKLNTGVNSKYVKEVINDLVDFGAPSDIAYLSKPHIGSDNLPKVVKNIRNEIIKLGGKVLFNTKLTDLVIENGMVKHVVINGKKEYFNNVVLAVGHSARDVYKMLNLRGVFMEPKHFAVGVRIEHLQKDIDISQYGVKGYNLGVLPPSAYKLTSNFNGRGVFTFCMCPGGYVMPSQSEKNTIVTNGMSNYLRDGLNANSAVIVQTTNKDFSESLFGGMEFQESLEKKAFIFGGGEYLAPVQLFGDFIKNTPSSGSKGVEPTYKMGVKYTNLNGFFNSEIENSLKFGIEEMGKRLKGFNSENSILTAVESRTSSPIRITRTENFNSVNVSNLYPVGEGCGYAGGIASAGADGKKLAEKLYQKYMA